MAEKKITRKVITKAVVSASKETEESSKQTEEAQKGAVRTKKVCFFCQSKTNPSYTDTAVLRRFMSERAKIVSHLKSSLCSKHQRFVTKQIKYARHLALLPFTPKV